MIVGSYVPEGVAVGDWVQRHARAASTAFYDIDTPVTLAKLERGDFEYLSPELIPRLRPLSVVHRRPDAAAPRAATTARRRRARSTARSTPTPIRPLDAPKRWDLGYLGTYSDDRQPTLETLLLEPARRLPQLQLRASPARSIPTASTGRRTSSGSSICRRPSTPHSTPPRASR